MPRTKKLSANIKNVLTNIKVGAIIFLSNRKDIFFYLEDQSNEKT